MHTSTSESNTTTINNLFDDSLSEIFCRLPSKCLFTCKSVSKHWFTLISTLISDPNFHSLYITHQHSFFQNLQTKEDQDIDQHFFILNPYNALIIIPNAPSLQFDTPLEKHVHLNFLGSHFEPTKIKPQISKFIFGCSNGLLLCGNPRQNENITYHVCNPLTKVSLELPCAPTICARAGVLVGFTCDPYYHVEEKTNINNVFIATSNRRFRVVRIPQYADRRFSFYVDVFSSETGKWNRRTVSCKKGFASGFYLTIISVEHSGKLYFTGQDNILVYDPYNDENVALVIDLPSDFAEVYKGCIGFSCERLRLSTFPIQRTASTIGDMHQYSGKVWELQCCDCGNGKVRTIWKLVREFCLSEIIGHPMFEELKETNVRPTNRFLAFHPYDEDTVFLKFGDYILSCNLLTHRFKASKYEGRSLFFDPITPVVLPWWPTPIPSLPLSTDPIDDRAGPSNGVPKNIPLPPILPNRPKAIKKTAL